MSQVIDIADLKLPPDPSGYWVIHSEDQGNFGVAIAEEAYVKRCSASPTDPE